MQKLFILILSLSTLPLSSCGLVHRIDIQQGNIIEEETLHKLTIGMSKERVQFVMGSPLLTDVFHNDRWDYYYSFQKKGDDLKKRHVSLIFERDQLVQIEGDVPAVLQQPTPSPLPEEEAKEPIL